MEGKEKIPGKRCPLVELGCAGESMYYRVRANMSKSNGQRGERRRQGRGWRRRKV